MSYKKLTKKQKELNKKQRHMGTQTYARKQKVKQLKKDDLKWSRLVREKFDGKCIICDTEINVHAHHLIPREIMETRHDVSVGVALCAKHHKFGLFSAHRNPLWFMLILEDNYPKVYKKCLDKISKLQELYPDKVW